MHLTYRLIPRERESDRERGGERERERERERANIPAYMYLIFCDLLKFASGNKIDRLLNERSLVPGLTSHN